MTEPEVTENSGQQVDGQNAMGVRRELEQAGFFLNHDTSEWHQSWYCEERLMALSLAERERILALKSASETYEKRQAQKRKWEYECRTRRQRLRYSGCELEAKEELAITELSYRDERATSAVRRWVETKERKPLLAISGTIGVGKSFAASLALACWSPSVRYFDSSGAWWRQDDPDGSGPVWIKADELCKTFINSFYMERLQRIRDTEFLVVDDVGSESDEKQMTAALIDLCDARGSRPWIITTNVKPQLFNARYNDPRLHSRFEKIAQWEAIKAPDLRKEGVR